MHEHDNPRILVTGGSGFVGSALLRRLSAKDFYARALFRGESPELPENVESVPDFELSNSDKSHGVFEGIDCVVHCAARVHVMTDSVADPLAEFRKVNVEGTLKLAKGAANAGVRRFIFLSSVKVHGESSQGHSPLNELEDTCPSDPYGHSKLEAENGLRALSRQTGMEVSIVRCPLVYGPGVKGNFRALLRLADSPWPLPLGRIDNARSLLFVDNLTDFLMRVIAAPEAANDTFLVSDGRDLSTSEIVSSLRLELGRPSRLWPFPWALARALCRFMGKDLVLSRLLDSLQVDSSKARRVLGWTPPYSVEEGLAATILADRNRELPLS